MVGHPSGIKEPPEQLGMAVPRRLAHHPVAPIIDLVEVGAAVEQELAHLDPARGGGPDRRVAPGVADRLVVHLLPEQPFYRDNRPTPGRLPPTPTEAAHNQARLATPAARRVGCRGGSDAERWEE